MVAGSGLRIDEKGLLAAGQFGLLAS